MARKNRILYRFLVTALVGYFLGALAGCSSLLRQVIAKPTVAVKSVKLADIDGAAAKLLIGIEVDNPNSFALKIDKLKYEVEIGGRAFTTGNLDHISEIPAKKKAVVEIPLAVKYSDLFSSMIELIRTRTSRYVIKGSATVGAFDIPFHEKGDLKLD